MIGDEGRSQVGIRRDHDQIIHAIRAPRAVNGTGSPRQREGDDSPRVGPVVKPMKAQ